MPVEEIPASRSAAISTTSRRLSDVIRRQRWDFFKEINMDLSLLTESELELLGKLLAKSAGLFDGDVIPQFRIERVLIDPNAAEEK
jgi:hypothetical protein